jgi:hypothetical protein
MKVFRSIVKEARLSQSGVEWEMYDQPTQNVWWKYRQKTAPRKASQGQGQTVRVGIPQSPRPDNTIYTTGQVATMLGISADLLRWRIKIGEYPDAPRGNGDRRLFTIEHIQRLRAAR